MFTPVYIMFTQIYLVYFPNIYDIFRHFKFRDFSYVMSFLHKMQENVRMYCYLCITL